MLEKKIQDEIENFFSTKHKYGQPKNERFQIPLAVPSYGHEEVIDALDSMLSTWVTMGKKVKSFEEQFSNYIGCKNGTIVPLIIQREGKKSMEIKDFLRGFQFSVGQKVNA